MICKMDSEILSLNLAQLPFFFSINKIKRVWISPKVAIVAKICRIKLERFEQLQNVTLDKVPLFMAFCPIVYFSHGFSKL